MMTDRLGNGGGLAFYSIPERTIRHLGAVEGTLDPLVLPMARTKEIWHSYANDRNRGSSDESSGNGGNNWTSYGDAYCQNSTDKGVTTGEHHDWRGGSSSNQNEGWAAGSQHQQYWSPWENQASRWDQSDQDPWQKEGQDPWCKKSDEKWSETHSSEEKNQGALMDSARDGSKTHWEQVQQNQVALEEKMEQRLVQVEQECKSTKAVAADVTSRLEGILVEAKSLHEKTDAVLGQQALLETLNLSLKSIADSLSATRASFKISVKEGAKSANVGSGTKADAALALGKVGSGISPLPKSPPPSLGPRGSGCMVR
jgi:hypothetical protein